jgi:predicted AlkP superfamily phosphohydrolase/phosphomutase
MASTLMLGLDGATFDVLEPYCQDGTMPFLREFAARGVRAGLRSTIPPLTPCAWTSLITGRPPGEHGVFDFVRVTRHTDHLEYQMATRTDIRCETIWSIAGRHGRRVAALNFPAAFPPEPVNGYVVPGFVPWRHLRRAIHPPDFYQELSALPDFNPKELVLDLEQERKAIQVLEQDQYEEWILFHIRREERWLGVLSHLIRKGTCDLIAIVFDGVDKLQHICWRFIEPSLRASAAAPWERKAVELCAAYFRRLDEILADAITLAGKDARVVMASDHGFGPTADLFYVNAWLHQEGYLHWAPGVAYDEDAKVMLDGTRSPAALFDWQRTLACSLSSGSNGVYIRVAATRGGPGVPPNQYKAFRAELRRKLLAVRHPETGEAVVERVLTREEAFPGRAMEHGPDLTLQLRDHGFVSVLNARHPLRRRPQIVGTHHPRGVFLAAGPGIRSAGDMVEDLSILDVTPVLLHCMGLPVPEDLAAPVTGRFWSDLFDGRSLALSPPQIGPPTVPPTDVETRRWQAPPASEPGVLDDEHLQRRMKLLGYL